MTKMNLLALAQQQSTTVSTNTPLSDIVATLSTIAINSLPVLNEQKQLVGLVSEQDCHKALLMSSYHCDKPVTAIDIMQQNPLTITAQQSIADIAIQTVELAQDSFPLIHKDHFVGSISRTNILSALNNSLSLCS
ncbi:CBS domain-containing protein [Litorilituus sediminis]|uniref:CBS domain-containing protein n=1 Tax=Litorilituus sediminis TaxID=718192 RepID=A0A4P6P7L1_9GAMM|nr:CBS domain-containing protein [Litorilituus sediminis]QBG37514.1 CBS domain-containing protein [Litorilituus sediminis]